MPFGTSRGQGFNNPVLANFAAGNFRIDSNGLRVYNGVPAANNLLLSVNGASSYTDNFGNIVLPYLTLYLTGAVYYAVNFAGIPPNIGAIQQYQSTSQSAGWGAVIAAIELSSTAITILNQILQVNAGMSMAGSSTNVVVQPTVSQTALEISGADNNNYTAGHLILPATATPQTVNSVTAATITGCSGNVNAANYKLRVVIQYAGNQAAGTANFSVAAPAASVKWISGIFVQAANLGSSAQTNTLGTMVSPTLSTSVWTAIMEGYCTFTASGTAALQAACSVAADTFKIVNAVFEIIPS